MTCSHSSWTESGRFSGSAAGNQEVNARFNLPRYQITQRIFVDRAVLGKRCDQSGTTASELHG